MKKGFTLSEILITLGVIGIVASMTIPTMVTSKDKQVWGASLAKAVNTMSNSVSIMISKGDSYGLSDSQMFADIETGTNVKTAFKNHLGKVLIFTDNYSDGTSSYTAVPKTLFGTEKSGLFNDYTKFITKGDITYFVKVATGQENNFDYERDIYVMDILIDINGNKVPNTIGKDIFGFLMTDEGRMRPYGGVGDGDVSTVLNNTTAGGSERYDNGWLDYCDPPADGYTDNGFSCTARVVKENYKINY